MPNYGGNHRSYAGSASTCAYNKDPDIVYLCQAVDKIVATLENLLTKLSEYQLAVDDSFNDILDALGEDEDPEPEDLSKTPSVTHVGLPARNFSEAQEILESCVR